MLISIFFCWLFIVLSMALCLVIKIEAPNWLVITVMIFTAAALMVHEYTFFNFLANLKP